MILDSRKQKELLLTMIKAVPLQGNYEQMKDSIQTIEELMKAVSEAATNEM